MRSPHRPWRLITLLLMALGLLLGGCPAKKPPPPPREPATKAVTQPATKRATQPAGLAEADRAPEPRMIKHQGFMTPESVLHDPQREVLLVSNINGSPLAKDGNGFISRLSDSGELMQLKWIDGAKQGITLNAPKGMAVVGHTLYVADITHLRLFNRETGAPAGQVEIPGATFLNDVVAATDRTVYVSDSGMSEGFSPSGTDAIWRVSPGGEPEILIKSTALGRPNGLTMDGDDLVVVTMGSGEVYRINREKKRTLMHKAPRGSLDGVERISAGTFLISSWEAKAVYRLKPDGAIETVIDKVNAPADIAYNVQLKQLIIPLFHDNALMVVQL